jgi:preprotein translocase subunit SecE
VTATRTDTASPRPAAGGPGGRPGRYIREIISELRKVLWPSRKELTTYTIVVIVFVVIMVALVAGLDLGLAKLVLQIFG